jgi:hypothetical protein
MYPIGNNPAHTGHNTDAATFDPQTYHLPRTSLRAQESASHVDIQDPAELLRGIIQRFHLLQHTSRCDQTVDTALRIGDFTEQGLQSNRVAHVDYPIEQAGNRWEVARCRGIYIQSIDCLVSIRQNGSGKKIITCGAGFNERKRLSESKTPAAASYDDHLSGDAEIGDRGCGSDR